MAEITISKNNLYGGKCQICKKNFDEINEIWNKNIKHSCGDKSELTICNDCIKEIICSFIDKC